MQQIFSPTALKSRAQKITLAVMALLLAAASLTPLLLTNQANAAQLTSRKVTIDKSKVSDTDVGFTFSYSINNTTSTKAGIIYEFCTQALGACTLPTGMNVQTSNVHDSQGGWPTNATAFAPVSEAANVGECTANTNTYMICYSRDETVATGTTGGAVTHTISGITAPSSAQSVYVRISLYTNDDFAGANQLQSGGTDETGTVAAAFVDQITVSGRVQERLDFCMAAVDDADSMPGTVSTCTALSDTNVDIGVIDNTAISVAPVTTTATNGSDDDYGISMVNTNASSGVVIAYYPEAAATGNQELRSFRVTGAACTAGGASATDQCFIDAASASETFTAGTERFGVYIPCIDQNDGTRSTTANLTAATAYNGSDNAVTTVADCENEAGSTEFAWNDAATAATLASSTTVVDDEIVKLRWGATAGATTPTGAYTVTTTYIATPTF